MSNKIWQIILDIIFAAIIIVAALLKPNVWSKPIVLVLLVVILIVTLKDVYNYIKYKEQK